MTRFLSNDKLWHEIEVRSHVSRNTKAAIAYYGSNGAKLIGLKRSVTVFTYGAVSGPLIAAVDRAVREDLTSLGLR